MLLELFLNITAQKKKLLIHRKRFVLEAILSKITDSRLAFLFEKDLATGEFKGI